VVGVVDQVDARNNVIEMTTDRDSRGAPGRRLDLYYDAATTVEFEGRDYQPADLEPGDHIVANVDGDVNYLEVHSILVTRDASPGDVFDPDPNQTIVGTLREIDERDRTLTVDVGRDRAAVVAYDDRTQVLYGDRRIAITELRAYDELQINLVPGTREGLADTISIVHGDPASYPGDGIATARGEVVFVDESRRELVIISDDRGLASFDAGRSTDPRANFDTGRDDRTTFQYEPNVVVEYRGDYYGPSNLERGDGVEIDYERVGDELWANRILVTYSAQ
jgi:hypothetical protein